MKVSCWEGVTSGTRCGHVPPLRGWWIHSARSPSRSCCCCCSSWPSCLSCLARSDCLRLLCPPRLTSFASSVSRSAPGPRRTDKQSACSRCPSDPGSLWRHQWEVKANCLVSLDSLVPAGLWRQSQLRVVFFAVQSDIPRHSLESLSRTLLLPFPKWNTVNVRRSAPQGNFSPHPPVREEEEGGGRRRRRREGFRVGLGWMHRLRGFNKFCQVLRERQWKNQCQSPIDQLGVILVSATFL